MGKNMFTALDKNNNLIDIKDTCENEEYFCKHCREKLIVKAKNSDKKAPHFCHRKNSDCVVEWAQHDMSEWHKNWQNYFPLECREVIMKNGSVKHIADVCVDKMVIEFQHSPISYKNFTGRNQFYTSLGYDVIWVFDATDKVDFRAEEQCYHWKNVQNQFVTNDYNGVFIFFEINDNGNIFLFHPKEITPTKIILYPTTDFWGRFFWRESFLKEFGVRVPENFYSFSELQQPYTTQMRQTPRVILNSGRKITSGLRGPRINYVMDNQLYKKSNWKNYRKHRGNFKKR